MKQLSKLLICLMALYAFGSKLQAQTDKEKLLGYWNGCYSKTNFISFGEDKVTRGQKGGRQISKRWELLPGQKYNLIIKGVLQSGAKDISGPNGEFKIQSRYILLDKYLVTYGIKPSIGDIDEVNLYTRDSSDLTPQIDREKINIKVRNNEHGIRLVLFTNDVKKVRKNPKANLLIEVDSTLNLSNTAIDLTDYAFKNFNVSFKGEKLPVYFNRSIPEISKNKPVCILYGFNQIDRRRINKRFDKKLKGDILMFYVGPLSEFNSCPDVY